MSDAKPNLFQRLNAVQQEVTYIQKEKKQGMRYSIVSHDDVTGKVRPVMVKHGVLYYPVKIDNDQVGNRTQCSMSVRFVNVDDPGEFIDVATMGYGIDDQDKGPGKAISYAVKYALLKVLGLETGDDPDKDQDVRFIHSDSIHAQNIKDFMTALDAAKSESEVTMVINSYRGHMADAEKEFPAKVAEARSKVQQKLAQFKEKAA